MLLLLSAFRLPPQAAENPFYFSMMRAAEIKLYFSKQL